MSPINTNAFISDRGLQPTALDAFRSPASHNHDRFNSGRPVSAAVAGSPEAPLNAKFSSDSSRQPSPSTTYKEDLVMAEDGWKLDAHEDPPVKDSDSNPYRRVYRLHPPARPLVQKPKHAVQPPEEPQVHKGPPADDGSNPYHRIYVAPQQNHNAARPDKMQGTQPEYNPNRRVYSSAPVLHSVPSQKPDYNPYRRVYGSPQQHYQQLHRRSDAEQGSAALTILTLVLLACALAAFFFAGKGVYRRVQRRRDKEWSWKCTGRCYEWKRRSG